MDCADVRELAKAIAGMLYGRHASDVRVLDVGELTPVADFFVMANGRNTRHLKSLSGHAADFIGKNGGMVIGREGTPESGWMIVDTGDVVVHLFDRERREIYNLDVLWGDAGELEFPAPQSSAGED